MHDIDKLLPGTIVKNFSDGWSTILSENFQVGDMDKAAKKLSKAINLCVMSIEYHDDDVFKMSIYRKGRTITTHISSSESCLPHIFGKPRLIIEELGFDEMEEKVLKAILSCEDLGKKIELLQHFLGVSIWIDYKMAVDDSITDYQFQRNLSIVEVYIKETKKRNRISNQTQARLIQEFEGAFIESLGDHKYLIGLPPYDRDDSCYKEEQIFFLNSEGILEPMLDVSTFHHRRGYSAFKASHGYLYFISQLNHKYYLFDYKGNKVFEASLGGSDIYPLDVFEDGGFLASVDQGKSLREYKMNFEVKWEIANAGYPFSSNHGIYLNRRNPVDQSWELAKINRNGIMEATFPIHSSMRQYLDGKLVSEETGRVICCCDASTSGKKLSKIFILTNKLEFIKEIDVEGWVYSIALDSENHKLFLCLPHNELIVMDTQSYLIVARRKWMADSHLLTVDSCGRAVVLTGTSQIDLLDSKLNDISRHRLKGQVLSESINERGNLCLLTGTGGAHEEGGADRMVIRMYEICVLPNL